MKLLSEREQVRAVSQEWKKSHRDPECRMRDGRTAGEIADGLGALDPETATAEDVGVVIGNRCWVRQQPCDECGEYSWSCVKLGGLPDYLDCTATICEGCLRTALDLIEWERRAVDAKRSRAEFADAVKRNLEDCRAWQAAVAAVTGTDIAPGRDWTAVVDTPKDGEP